MSLHRVKGGFLFKLLRGEFVTKYERPLSSDAFTAFGEHDAENHNAEVKEATCYLLHHLVPQFATYLISSFRSLPTSQRLIEELHRTGINGSYSLPQYRAINLALIFFSCFLFGIVRHLGRVRAELVKQGAESELMGLVLLECVARVLKNELRTCMRALQGSSEETSYRALALTFLNSAFGCGTRSTHFWCADVKHLLRDQFPFALQPYEVLSGHDLRVALPMVPLCTRLLDLAGISLHRLPPLCCCSSVHQAPFSSCHLHALLVKEKHMYAIPRIEADTLAELARTKQGNLSFSIHAFYNPSSFLTLSYGNYY